MDLRLTIQEETQNKPLRSRWVVSHRDTAKAKTKEEQAEIKRNNRVNHLAKMATGRPHVRRTFVDTPCCAPVASE